MKTTMVPYLLNEDYTLYNTLEDGKIRIWVSKTKTVDYESLYRMMIQLNKLIAEATLSKF